MDQVAARRVLPRFLNAVTEMATSREGTVRGRLAAAVEQVTAFRSDDLPEELRARFDEFFALIASGKVPTSATHHPNYLNTTPAYYISAAKAQRAAQLLVEMFEALVYSAAML